MNRSARDFNIITNRNTLERSAYSEASLLNKTNTGFLERRFTTINDKFNDPNFEQRPPHKKIMSRFRINYKNLESRQLYPIKPEPIMGYDRLMETKTCWDERKLNPDETNSMLNCSSVPYNFVYSHTKKPDDTYKTLGARP